MHRNALQRNGYQAATRATGTTRDVEYQVFSKITGRLNQAARDDAPFAEIAEALQENMRLWNIIAIDVASDENELPRDLRGRLFYLSEFTRSHTQKVLRREADLAALIEINTIIMRGLRQNSPGKGPEQCQA